MRTYYIDIHTYYRHIHIRVYTLRYNDTMIMISYRYTHILQIHTYTCTHYDTDIAQIYTHITDTYIYMYTL
jgi:hypothetical protein